MSYDLFFWRQTKNLSLEPGAIVDRLAQEPTLDGVVAFPRQRVRAAFRHAFPELEDHDLQLDWEGGGTYFQVGFGHANEREVHLIVVNCGYDLLASPDTMNRIINVCLSLGCALYDAQTGRRYEQLEPPFAV